MNKSIIFFTVLALSVSGCAGNIPYRAAGFDPMPACMDMYKKYSHGQKLESPDSEDACWLRSIEEHGRYDLLFAEFDDQGWIQGSADLPRPRRDHLDSVFDKLYKLYDENRQRGLSLVVFVHGWHHSAKADDGNVLSFRKLLDDLAFVEASGVNRRVVGLYVGWRGDSLTPSLINWITFWERKNTAEKVSQGSVRELFTKLDLFRDQASENSRRDPQSRKLRMLTIGHSFGGLITFESLSSDFLRAAATQSAKRGYAERAGDLVVIVNPAFEGTRYEPVKIAGQRLQQVERDQLPIVIVATSKGDWATRATFPLARRVSTLLESTPGAEGTANVFAVGHNDRYTTHKLSKCPDGDTECLNACKTPGAVEKEDRSVDHRRNTINKEYRHMARPAQNGFDTKEHFCGQMLLTATEQWRPIANPFWVVETTAEIIGEHNDFFNENFQAFIRQVYLAIILATDKATPSIKR